MNKQFKVDKARKDDVTQMLDLNYKIYPPEWHVTPNYVEQIMEKNPLVYNILRTDKGIKGIVSFFPLEKKYYELVLKGELEEKDIAKYLLNYSTSKEVYLYLISIIVDIHDPMRKIYAKEIIQSIPTELKRIENSGVKVKEIGAIAISQEGEQILPKIGFRQDKNPLLLNNQEYPIFRASVEEVLNAIQQ